MTSVCPARPTRSVFAALLLMLAAAAQAQAPLKPASRVEGIIEYRLANGLQLLLAPDDSKPSTTVNVTYRVGSKHENYGETGMAHLLEHLVFKPTDKHANAWSEFEKRGLRANGSTWYDRTNYFASFAANEETLKWYLGWEADVMVNSRVLRTDLDTEMTVVRNEMERGENNPGLTMLLNGLATMYRWHNYGKSTIGARADVENVDIPRLRNFYKTYYQPDNATLIISGKFDPAKALAHVQQTLGKIPAPKRTLPKAYTLDPVQDGERSIVSRRVGGQLMVGAAYHVPPGAAPDFAAVNLLNQIVSEPPSGRLHKALVEQDKIAAAVGAFTQPLSEPGYTLFYAVGAPGADAQVLSDKLLAVAEGLKASPISEAELARAKIQWLNGWEKQFTDPEQVGTALSEYVSQGDWRLFFLLRDRVKAATLADVQRVADERFIRANRTLSQYIPSEKPQRAPNPAFVDLAAQMKEFKPAAEVAAVAAFDTSPTNIDKQTQTTLLANGLQLSLLPKPTRGNAVEAHLILRLGSVQTLEGLRSVSDFTAALLDKGTAKLDRQAFRDRLDALKIELGVNGGADVVNVHWSTTREFAAESVKLIASMLRQPLLEASALDEQRAQLLTGLQAQRSEPQALAPNAANQAFNEGYGANDVRRARTFDEIEAQAKAVTAEQMRDFQRRFYGGDHIQVALVGDFDAKAVQAAAAESLGDWRAATAYAQVPWAAQSPKGRLQLLKTPDKPNAMFYGRKDLPLSDASPEAPALEMAAYLMGGGTDSRLWKRIREKEGLSYGVGGRIAWSEDNPRSPWQFYAIYAPQNREKVEAALREELSKMLDAGFSEAEVKAGAQSLLNQRRLERAQDSALSSKLAGNLHNKRRLAFSQGIDEAIAKLDAATVNAALRKYFKLEDLQLVFAGDFK